MHQLTPREIVSELDKFIIGQNDAKRMVAIAMRNRWRRQQVPPELRDEISPKNIIMIGSTGVGKTEIARRLARLSGSPFFKVEASKFTEVGYVGRDVESMIRDLMEIAVNMVRTEEMEKVKVKAEKQAEERLLDLLYPPTQQPRGSVIAVGTQPGSAQAVESGESTREKLRTLWRQGKMDDRQVELEVTEQSGTQIGVMAMPGMEGMENQVRDMMGQLFPKKRKQRKMNVREAYEQLLMEESERLVDMDKVIEIAKERVEQSGIVFLDEIDKICSSTASRGAGTADVSREGVQRDLLPIVEGSVVNSKYGMINTDHILFIAAGAFHLSKPSDLIPELQGRFPLRVELSSLHKEEFYRILTEPQNALTIQYKALLATEGVDLVFADEALLEVAAFAQTINEETENIGARRLYTILEKILSDLSFEAPDKSGQQVIVDREYVLRHLEDVTRNRDLSRYIL
ncbi:MAG: ATP-dependent protease ATPase subunit HslU [Proteobacteria bacterium]|nr:ATP-dependent protease ATPase subunit HslU [Pseudomonadota bacterium]